MAHVAYLAPDYRPDQGATFLTFVFWPVRDVLDESLKAELRHKAYAAAAERGLRVVMDVMELGDVLNESETQRRERMTTARYALAVAAILGFHSEPETPEERVLIEQERAMSLRAIEEGLKRVSAESAAMVRKCFWEDKSVAAAGRELGLGPDDARFRVQVALKVIGQLLPAG